MLFARSEAVNPRAKDVISAARLMIENKLWIWDTMIVQLALSAA
ncbi:MAG: hypothetical protein ABR550_01715 [Wenzhouxiangellaceae bacterium]